MRMKHAKTKIKAGEYAVYECIQRDEYYETPDGPEVKLLCNLPDPAGEASLVQTAITPSWPTCAPLPCQCIGYDLDEAEAKLALEENGACQSNDTYTMYSKIVDDASYIIPKRFNCGTFKPSNPTWETRCTCDDVREPRKYKY